MGIQFVLRKTGFISVSPDLTGSMTLQTEAPTEGRWHKRSVWKGGIAWDYLF